MRQPRPHLLGPDWRRRTPVARGFTLIEAVVSMAIIAIVLLACGSVLVLAARVMTASASGTAAQADAGQAVATQIATDLRLATAFTERTSTAVTFTVPDRNGDGQPETIRYAWYGAGGGNITINSVVYGIAPNTLIRQFNGGPPATLAERVQAFSFNYLVRTIGQPTQSPASESPDQNLLTHSGLSLNVKAYALKSTNWPAEYVQVAFPANTVSWKINHVKLQIARASANATGTLVLEVHGADSAHKPTSTVLGAASVDMTTIATTKTTVDLMLSPAAVIPDPAQGVVLVVKTTASNPANVYYDSLSTDFSIGYMTTTNSGGSWSTPVTTSALQMSVWGTYTTQSSGPPPPQAEPAPAYQ
jgi:prepilin-type N-terminal cleavage/methylation domain-containing protein